LPTFEVDFTNFVGGPVQQVQFDFAVTDEIAVLGAMVFDSAGDSELLTASVNSFDYGGGMGSYGRATFEPTGSLNDLARITFNLADENFTQLQIGFDNLTISDGSSADFSGDGSIDGQDLLDWQSAYSSSVAGDADSDGDTDGTDFLIWQREYTGSALATTAAVPEPTSWTLGFVAALFTLAAKHRFQ